MFASAVFLCRHTLRESFPDKLWLDIFSKSDLLTAHLQAADMLQEQAHDTDTAASSSAPASTELVWSDSTAAAQGLADIDGGQTPAQQEPLQASTDRAHGAQVNQALTLDQADRSAAADPSDATLHAAAQHAAEDGVAASLRNEQDEWGGVMDSTGSMREAVQAALVLPAALRISSVTQDGIQDLQKATMQLLSISSMTEQQHQ